MGKILHRDLPRVSGQKRHTAQHHMRSPLPRSLLIAAVIAVMFCVTALAIAYSLRDAARMDMGISAENPIPEWTEYEAGTADGARDAAQAVLVATMCSGERLYAYVQLSPVPVEIAVNLADNASPEYEWDLNETNAAGCTFDIEQTSYDTKTQTALVKVSVHGAALEEMERVELSLALTHNLKKKATYGPVVVPVTSSQMAFCPADVVVENRKAHFEEILGPDSETLQIPDYVSEGRIRQIAICAGYIEVTLETPSISQWTAASNADQVNISQDLPPEIEDWFGRVLFCKSWTVSVNEALRGAKLNYRDGTSVVIDEIPRAYAAIWTGGGEQTKAASEGIQTYQFIPKQAFDFSAVRSVTIGNTEYPFITMDEIAP